MCLTQATLQIQELHGAHSPLGREATTNDQGYWKGINGGRHGGPGWEDTQVSRKALPGGIFEGEA